MHVPFFGSCAQPRKVLSVGPARFSARFSSTCRQHRCFHVVSNTLQKRYPNMVTVLTTLVIQSITCHENAPIWAAKSGLVFRLFLGRFGGRLCRRCFRSCVELSGLVQLESLHIYCRRNSMFFCLSGLPVVGRAHDRLLFGPPFGQGFQCHPSDPRSVCIPVLAEGGGGYRYSLFRKVSCLLYVDVHV